jgi:hypothetical protein
MFQNIVSNIALSIGLCLRDIETFTKEKKMYLPLVAWGALVFSFLVLNPFEIVTTAVMVVQWFLVNLFFVLQFIVINMITLLLHTISHVAFYLFVLLVILLVILIPALIFLGICAFKTKPTEESFRDYLSAFAKIAEVESKCVDQKEKEKQPDDNQGYTGRAVNYVWNGCRNWGQGKAINLLVKQKLLVTDSYTYNCIVCRIGVVPVDGTKRIFVGLYDSWQPWS